MTFIISILTGALLSIVISINGFLGQAVGDYTSSIIIHLFGLITMILLVLIKKENFKDLKKIPLYMYSAGLIGVFTVVTNSLTITKLGVSLTIALGLLGQSLLSIFIDHFGLLSIPKNPFNRKKCIGLVLMSLGLVIMTIY